MKKIHPILFIIAIVCLNIPSVSAQRTSPEFSMFGSSGYSFFGYTPSIAGTTSSGYYGDFGLGITAFFSQQFGFHIGAAFGLYNVKGSVAAIKHITPNLYDIDALQYYDVHTTLSNYSEIQNTIFMSIPIMFQFQTKMNQNMRKKTSIAFFVMGGVKTLIPFKGKYETTVTLKNELHYPDEIITNRPVDQKSYGNYYYNPLVMLSFEAGLKWRFGNKVFLYTGAYFDFGLNDPIKNERAPYQYFNSVEKLSELKLLQFTNKVNLMTVGLKLRWAFALGPNRGGGCY